MKQKKFDDKLPLENIKVGDIVPDLHGENIEITDDLIEQMRQFEQETKKSAIWRNKITGSFLFYKWNIEHPEEKVEKVIDKSLNEAIEKEVVDEENKLLDVVADYKAEYNVKKVNTNTKKFKAFYEEWKQAE